MDALLALLALIEPQHWLVLGLVLLIAEMASGTTYLLWPAVAAFITALVAFFGVDAWLQLTLFAVLVIALTYFGRPLVQSLRKRDDSNLNERGQALIGTRGIVTEFANGAGAVKLGDTVWRAVSDEALTSGESVQVDAVDGVTLKVKRA
ncbi:putative activity regulator of membrane protease YbbK [alpha proteobacterium U9-1i]|nr:putative activity regulator of membrane protease YbbK [alpha proteobacterium U9-1i]